MSKLYIVPTPIGNLEDITLRAIRILKEVDLILAEDTRKSAILLKHYAIATRMISHHKFNEHKTSEHIAQEIASGRSVALISDAGTPGVSDPGFFLVRTCLAAGLAVECLPGATAFVPALVNSGFPCDRFCFEGFLPQKKGRVKKLESLKQEERTIVFYESPHRILKTLEQIAQIISPDRLASVSRELSKLHEENVRGTVSELIDHFKLKEAKGEIVLVLEGVEKTKGSDKKRSKYELMDDTPDDDQDDKNDDDN